MKKVFLSLAVTALALTATFVACDDDNTINPNEGNDNITTTVAVTGVTLNQTTADLAVGDTIRLTANVLPDSATDKAVTWTSSSTAVATVANGKVTAVAVGTANITVTTQDGSKTATCALTVVAVGIPVTGVTLSQTTANLAIGDTLRLTATVAPDSATNKAVAWTSSSTAVATVSNGKITAVAIGTATITVATENGSKTASCTVTVNPVPVASVTLNPTSATLGVGYTQQLTATVQPSNAANKAVTWASNNTAVATVSNGLVTAVAQGSATITVTTQDGNKTATCAVTVYTPVNLGTVSFATTQTWTVGSQEWSDAVQATGCNKTNYDGGGERGDGNLNLKIDCRSNPGYKGDLFSWQAVNEYKSQLCPSGWRVPTRQDFIDLYIALGGIGDYQYDTTLRDKYLNTWGGVYGGFCLGGLYRQGSAALYWSQSEASSDHAYSLEFHSNGGVTAQSHYGKWRGYALRCVR
jgi:uncharacterized protein (TIGR02145 family)